MNAHIERLVPPPGTSFFKRKTHVIFPWKEGANRQVYWVVTVYMYCTGAVPTDPDFYEKGGEIVLLLVHHGVLHTSDENWTRHAFTVEPSGVGGKAPDLFRYYPTSYSGTELRNGAITLDFNLEMSLPMYKNRGHESFLFNAQYKEAYVLAPKIWHSGKNVDGNHVFAIGKDLSNSPKSNRHDIRGVTVLKAYDTSHPVSISFHQEKINGTVVEDKFTSTIEINLNDF